MDAYQILQRISKNHRNSRKLFQKLSYGRAYTLIELADDAGISRKTVAGILEQMVEGGVLATRANRTRVYYFRTNSHKDHLPDFFPINPLPITVPEGMKYSRHCYNHLAGYGGVRLTDALLASGIIEETNDAYRLTENGEKWFAKLEINVEDLQPNATGTKKCLDFSERRSHLGGPLGDMLLRKMIEKGWVSPVSNSREILITSKGKSWLKNEFGIEAPSESEG